MIRRRQRLAKGAQRLEERPGELGIVRGRDRVRGVNLREVPELAPQALRPGRGAAEEHHRLDQVAREHVHVRGAEMAQHLRMGAEERLVEEDAGVLGMGQHLLGAGLHRGDGLGVERRVLGGGGVEHGLGDMEREEPRQRRIGAAGEVLALEILEIGGLRHGPDEGRLGRAPMGGGHAVGGEEGAELLDPPAARLGRAGRDVIGLAQRRLGARVEHAHGEIDEREELARGLVERWAELLRELGRIEQQALEEHLDQHLVEGEELVPAVLDDDDVDAGQGLARALGDIRHSGIDCGEAVQVFLRRSAGVLHWTHPRNFIYAKPSFTVA